MSPPSQEVPESAAAALNRIAAQEQLSPAEIAQAKRKYELGSLRIDTQEQLQSLSAEVKNPKVDRVVILTMRDQAIESMKRLISGGKSDFKNDTIFNHVRVSMTNAIDSQINSDIPVEYHMQWMNAATNFMVAEVASYSGGLLEIGEMEASDVDKAIIVMQDPTQKSEKSGQSGIGTLKDWTEKNHPGELAKIKQRTAEAEETKQKTEQEQAATQAATQETAQTQAEAAEDAAFQAKEEAAAPTLDKLFKYAEGLEDGTWKTSVIKLAVMLGGLMAPLSKIPYIGSWFSGFASNTLFAEKMGSADAKPAAALEKEFRKFRLPRALADMLKGKKTKDVIALINEHPEKITTDAKLTARLKSLSRELVKKDGAVQETALMEFMNTEHWAQGVNYKTAATEETVAAAPAAAPAPASPPVESTSSSNPPEGGVAKSSKIV